MNKKKINLIVPFTGLSGGIRVAFLYCNYLQLVGYDVVCYVPIIAYKFKSSTLRRIKMSLGNVVRSLRISWMDCKFKIRLVPYIKDMFIRKADVSIATAWPTAYDVNDLSSDRGKKVYFIQDYEIWTGPKKEVDGSYTLPLNRIVITKGLQELLKKKFNVNSTVIYNGLDENEYIQSNKINQYPKQVLMLYNESSNKGTREGIEVLKNIKQKFDIQPVLFGKGKKGKMVPNDFLFFENPDRDTLIELYRNASIYLFPSKNEAWGLPVMEAMSNKCAIVGCNVGCIKEICTNNKNVLASDDCNYKKIEKNLEIILKDEIKLTKLQEEGYKLAINYKWGNSYKQFEEYIKSLFD